MMAGSGAALWGWLCVIGSVVVTRLWLRHRLDVYRQSLFAIRDRLFDYAAAGYFAFDDPEYLRMRGMLNTLIRWADSAHSAGLIVSHLARPRRDQPVMGSYNNMLVRDAEADTAAAIASFVLVRAPLFYLVASVTDRFKGSADTKVAESAFEATSDVAVA